MVKGDIVLVPFPFTDLSRSKARPALVLAVTGQDITVAFISSELKWHDELDLHIIPDRRNGLKKTSLIRVSKLAPLDRQIIMGKLGELDQETIGQVNGRLIQLFQLRDHFM